MVGAGALVTGKILLPIFFVQQRLFLAKFLICAAKPRRFI